MFIQLAKKGRSAHWFPWLSDVGLAISIYSFIADCRNETPLPAYTVREYLNIPRR